jgi:hypothetical protein
MKRFTNDVAMEGFFSMIKDTAWHVPIKAESWVKRPNGEVIRREDSCNYFEARTVLSHGEQLIVSSNRTGEFTLAASSDFCE